MKHPKPLFDLRKDIWIDRYFVLPLWGRAVLVGVLATLLGFSLDEAAHAFGYPWFLERVYENATEGVVIGTIVFWLSLLREQRIEHRMREIAFLNHHIRNAMQTIEMAATEITDAAERHAVIDISVRRVADTLHMISCESDELSLESGIRFAA